MVEGVKAEGLIEDWLSKLEKEMQRSVRAVCKDGSRDAFQQDLKEFVSYQSQVALLGIQMTWTSAVQTCLEKSQREKIQELDKKKKDVNNVMQTLTELCLSDMNKLQRKKN